MHNKSLIDIMCATSVHEVVKRGVSRKHARLVQMQKDSGASIRTRFKKKRSNAEIAASQVARLKRQERYEEVLELYRQGQSIPTIAQALHMHHMTVRQLIAAGAFEDALSAQNSPLCSSTAISSLPGKADLPQLSCSG